MECLRSEFEIQIDRSEKRKQKGNQASHDDNVPSQPYREILAEITAIRTMLEDRIVPNKKVRQSQQDCVLKELKELRKLLQAD